ncbi:hypothetical protein [Alloprevotella tannerae]|uniref:hypothetical protein n=1 Tax=Alloprevotella tannerae TaxID=76122 RepID=UPI0025CF37B9|nr:hypothetical protein [Alloprevotella tannerae]
MAEHNYKGKSLLLKAVASLLIGGCGVVNLQTSPKIIAKIKRFSIKEKFLSIILHFIVCKDWFLSSQTTIDGVKT